jgi:hypothetical protein
MKSIPEIEDLIERLHIRANIRRSIPHRKSVQENKPDRIADLLDEAAQTMTDLLTTIQGEAPPPAQPG